MLRLYFPFIRKWATKGIGISLSLLLLIFKFTYLRIKCNAGSQRNFGMPDRAGQTHRFRFCGVEAVDSLDKLKINEKIAPAKILSTPLRSYDQNCFPKMFFYPNYDLLRVLKNHQRFSKIDIYLPGFLVCFVFVHSDLCFFILFSPFPLIIIFAASA